MRKPLFSVIALVLSAPICTAQARCSESVQLNAPGLPEADRRKVLEKIEQSTSCSPDVLSEQALWLIRDLGFFRAAPVATPTTTTTTPTISITTGLRYRFGGFAVFGNSALTRSQLKATYALQPGDLASARLIGKSLENLQKAYRKAGKQNEVTVPLARFNDTDHVLTMELQIDEGA